MTKMYHVPDGRTVELLECLASEGPPFIFACSLDDQEFKASVGVLFYLGDQCFRVKRMATEDEWRANNTRNNVLCLTNPVFFEAETD